jgi:hypothetical protein
MGVELLDAGGCAPKTSNLAQANYHIRASSQDEAIPTSRSHNWRERAGQSPT